MIFGKGNNVATKVTGLVGKGASGSSLVVKNPSEGSALELQVNADQAPLSVNADAGKATNLNADKLDDLDAFELTRSCTFSKILYIAGAANAARSGTASCDPKDKVLSGGFGGASGVDPGGVNSADTFIIRSAPSNIGQGWTVVYQSGATAHDIKV